MTTTDRQAPSTVQRARLVLGNWKMHGTLADNAALLAALRAGKIDGSQYSGECACLVGTIAKVRKCDAYSLPGIRPDGSRPSERWFLAIRPGDTPENNPAVKITEGWIEEFQGLLEIARNTPSEAI